MNATLNLVDQVLALGRRYQELGRHRDAIRLFTRLSGFRELPAAAAEETQARLAEMHLKRRRFAQARRHLAAALGHGPDNARYHYLMGAALAADDRGNLEGAAGHFTRASELAPDNARYRAESGLLAVRLGRTEEGLARLRQAAEHAPDNADVLGKLAKGLRLAGKGEEARAALRAALFRNAKAPRFRRLWAEFQLEGLRRREARRPAGENEPVLLPFVGQPSRMPPGEVLPTILRDGVGGPRPARRPDQRNVQ
jgi:tetratricopeptide (TPR) repeat protein